MTLKPVLAQLRRIDVARSEISAAADNMALCGFDVAWKELTSGREYLSFDAVGDTGVTPCLVDLRSWTHVHVPELSKIALGAADTETLRLLVNGVGDLVTGCDTAMPFASYVFREVVRPSMSESFPTIAAIEGAVYIAGPWHGKTAHAPFQPENSRLGMDVDFRLGRVQVRPSLLRQVAAGDVLLFHSGPFVALCGNKVIFSFSVNVGVISVEQIVNGTDVTELDDIDADSRIDVPGLEVPIEVILRRDSMSLLEISRLARGSTLTLADNAWENVQLRIGNQLYAVGELVDTGSGLGVQVKRVLAR